MSTENKDRITCHVLDTSLGRPAANLRIKLIGPLPHGNFSSSLSKPPAPPPPSANPGMASNMAGPSSSLPPSTGAAAQQPPPEPIHTFESLTDSDGRVKVWLPYSSSNSSGDIPVYTLEDVLGQATKKVTDDGEELEGAEGGPDKPQTWTLVFDTAGYHDSLGRGELEGAEAGGCFFPEVNITFTVMPGQRYHVPLLLSPYGYTTYRGS